MKQGESRKQYYEQRLIDKKQELYAVLKQLGKTLSDVDIIKLEKQAEDILSEIDNFENELSKLESNTLTQNKNNIECKLEKSFQKIDYSETKRIANLIKENFFQDGGAILFFLQRSKKQLGKYCIEELIEILMSNQIINGEIEGDYKRYPIDISNINYSPNKVGFLQGVSEHLGINLSSDLEEALTQIRNRIYSSLSIGSTIFIEIKGINKLTDKEEFLSWFVDKFWQPLINEKNIVLKHNKNKLIAALIADSKFPIKNYCSCYSSSKKICDSSSLIPDKIIEIPLSNWELNDIHDWLIRFWKISPRFQELTKENIDKIAQEIFEESEGNPESVCLRLREKLL